MRDVVASIVSLRSAINKTAMMQGEKPIFSAVLENERIVIDLSSATCSNEEDFRRIVEMLYKLVIESSESGSRFPQDSRIKLMDSALRDLRNHFFHSREHGKPKEVEKKYRKVGLVYCQLIGKDTPSAGDWCHLKTALLKLVEDGLERTYEIVSEGSGPFIIQSEDTFLFTSEGKKSISRKATKSGFYSPLATIPVFIPQFTHVPPPQLGLTKSCVYITTGPINGTLSSFLDFVKRIEQKWKTAPYLLSTYGSLNWTMSDDGCFVYGNGAKNLSIELPKYHRVAIGAIMQGCFGEHFDRTCFMVIFAYRKGEIVRDICVNLYTSCIPTSWNGFEDLFSPMQELMKDQAPIKIDHFTIEPIRYLSWAPIQRQRCKLDIVGGLTREILEPREGGDKAEMYSGIVVNSKCFSNLKYKQEDAWNLNVLRSGRSGFFDDIENARYRAFNPIKELGEVVVSITNTVPSCDEIDRGDIIDVNPPSVRTLMFSTYGADVIGVSVNCIGPRFRGEDDQDDEIPF